MTTPRTEQTGLATNHTTSFNFGRALAAWHRIASEIDLGDPEERAAFAVISGEVGEQTFSLLTTVLAEETRLGVLLAYWCACQCRSMRPHSVSREPHRRTDASEADLRRFVRPGPTGDVHHAKYVTLQMAEVSVPRKVIAAILTRLRKWAAKARAAPVPAVT